jgi:hypothetical protein
VNLFQENVAVQYNSSVELSIGDATPIIKFIRQA